ncbi:MAG: heavy-metal-associated domain-containing protein [Patescibacteria group bacterium]|nr:heavy-metal-associated domain-containing protein [Patescibacteria group bacterium]
MKTLIFRISGLTCPACKKLSEKKISAITGVISVSVNLDSGEATIESEETIGIDKIINALKDTPYRVVTL